MRTPLFSPTSSARLRTGLSRCRRGLSILDVLASASILTVLVSLFATLSVRIQRLTKDVEKDQFTLHELANLLDNEIAKQSLSPLSDSREHAANIIPDELVASPQLLTLWPRGQIFLYRSRDKLGERLTLTHFRDSEQPDAIPTTLTGWVPRQEGATP